MPVRLQPIASHRVGHDWSYLACMPDFPVLHYLPELAQTHVRWVDDAIQPSHPLSSLLLLSSIFPSIRVFSSESWVTQALSLPLHVSFVRLIDKIENSQLNLNFSKHDFLLVSICSGLYLGYMLFIQYCVRHICRIFCLFVYLILGNLSYL